MQVTFFYYSLERLSRFFQVNKDNFILCVFLIVQKPLLHTFISFYSKYCVVSLLSYQKNHNSHLLLGPFYLLTSSTVQEQLLSHARFYKSLRRHVRKYVPNSKISSEIFH